MKRLSRASGTDQIITSVTNFDGGTRNIRVSSQQNEMYLAFVDQLAVKLSLQCKEKMGVESSSAICSSLSKSSGLASLP